MKFKYSKIAEIQPALADFAKIHFCPNANSRVQRSVALIAAAMKVRQNYICKVYKRLGSLSADRLQYVVAEAEIKLFKDAQQELRAFTKALKHNTDPLLIRDLLANCRACRDSVESAEKALADAMQPLRLAIEAIEEEEIEIDIYPIDQEMICTVSVDPKIISILAGTVISLD